MNNTAQPSRLGCLGKRAGRTDLLLVATRTQKDLLQNHPVDAPSEAGSYSKMNSTQSVFFQSTVTRSILLLLTVSCTACAQLADPPKTTALAPQAAALNSPQLLRAIREEVGVASCDNDRQCHSLGVGLKACGGPETYIAWSSKSGNRERLLDLVTHHRDARKKEHESSDMASNCRFVPDPGAVCRSRAPDGKRVCQLGLGGQGRLD